MKNQKDKFITNCGNGAVYFGWLGTLIGLIALTSGKWDNWGDIEKTGMALSVAMLTLLYGYISNDNTCLKINSTHYLFVLFFIL